MSLLEDQFKAIITDINNNRDSKYIFAPLRNAMWDRGMFANPVGDLIQDILMDHFDCATAASFDIKAENNKELYDELFRIMIKYAKNQALL